MYTLIIVFKGGTVFELLFDNAEDAQRAQNRVTPQVWGDKILWVADAYGNHVNVNVEEVAACNVRDVAKHMEGMAACSLIQARAQVAAQKKAAADPTLRMMNFAAAPPGLVAS